MVEVNHLSDFLGIDLEVFEHARNSIPYPVSTVGHKDDLFGLGNSCCGNVLFEQGEDSIGIAERGVVDGKVVPPAAPFAVNGIDDKQLGFTPMAMEPMVPCRSSTPPFGASLVRILPPSMPMTTRAPWNLLWSSSETGKRGR